MNRAIVNSRLPTPNSQWFNERNRGSGQLGVRT